MPTSHAALRLLAGFVLLAPLLSGCAGDERAPETAVLDTLAFVGRETCTSCHQEEALAWEGSDHDRAMETPTPETVLGDFSGATFTVCGVETRFFTDDGRYVIRTQGPDGEMRTYPVEYTFGYDPLQQYLIELERGRIQAFTIAWDVGRQRWFSLTPDECPEPSDWLHWTGDGMNWNYMCADCHSTNLRRNFDLSADAYETSYSEIDVSCEACHGPGEAHVERARSGDPVSRLSASHSQVDTCAPCHSRRRIIHPDHLAGKPYLDHFEPELLQEDLYFADGQIQDEVYVYGSFLQSRMYANGVRCSDCHDPHSTRLKLEGNALCGQCHAPSAYDTFEHLRHPDDAAGSECVDCHMPERTYMVVDPRRDHSFQVPRPDISAAIGTPNACHGCHSDQSPEWAAQQIDTWHGPERPSTFAPALAGGRDGQAEAEPELIRLIGDTATADIVRATALSLLDSYATVRASETAADALGDSSALVRAAAVRNLSGEGDRSAAPRIESLLSDSVRLVRTEAARVLTQIAPGRYARGSDEPAAQAYWSALEEYRQGQLALSDQAAAHLNLAVVHEQLGEADSAAAAYRTAIRVDSTFVPAHLNLAMLYNAMRENGEEQDLVDAAEASLRTAVRLQPEMAQAHYTLGLLLAETPERLEEAAEHLATAAELDTADARVQYNAGLAHQQLGRADAAERLLLRAHRLASDHPDYLNALSVFYAQQEEWQTALTYTGRLLEHYPNNRDILQRQAFIRQQLGR